MEYRVLGKTELRVSALGFGCGNVGGLMVRGTPADRARAVARAIELGINYFDTAPSYGDGQSERHLGQALKALNAEVWVGTKFRLHPQDMRNIRGAIVGSLEASLQRLDMDHVDLLQLHNHITPTRGSDAGAASVRELMDEVVPTLQVLQQQGKIRFCGITGRGDTAALHQVIAAAAFHTVQVLYNLLNPSAAVDVPAGFPAQNFRRLLDRANEQRMGVIGIRVLAAGALSGTETRHPTAAPAVEPIASGRDYATDVQRAKMLEVLVREGHVQSLVEASLRFAVSANTLSTVLVGYSSLEHLESAAATVARGPLSTAALNRLSTLWKQLATNASAP